MSKGIADKIRAAYRTGPTIYPDDGQPPAAAQSAKRALGHVRRRLKDSRDAFCIYLLRLGELETVIQDRHGRHVPEDGEAPRYIRVAAYALQARVGDDGLQKALGDWCRKWAPWAPAKAGDMLRPILHEVDGRRQDLSAEKAASILGVTMADRTRLGLRTIGACDISKTERLKIAKQLKREKDRERVALKRKNEGRIPRAEWLSDSLSVRKPWQAEGISRRTWERRRNKADAGASRIGSTHNSCDTPASDEQSAGCTVGDGVGVADRSASASVVMLAPASGESASSLQSQKGTGNAPVVAGRADGSEDYGPSESRAALKKSA